MTTTIDEAKGVLSALEDKRLAAKAAAAEIAETIRELSYSAHVSGREARKRLDRLQADAAKQVPEITSLEAAIGEAKRRLADAVAADADEREMEDARTALAMVEDLRAAGGMMADGISRSLAGYQEATRISEALRKFGY